MGGETGGESIYVPTFEDEFNNSLRTQAMVVSMANSGPRTDGSPFFFTSVSTLRLNRRHSSSLWTSLNEMDAVNQGTELEDGSGGEAD